MASKRQHSASNTFSRRTGLKALHSHAAPNRSTPETEEEMLVEMGCARFLSRKVLGSRLLGWLIAVANESAIPPALEPVRRILAGLCDPTIKGVWQPLLDA